MIAAAFASTAALTLHADQRALYGKKYPLHPKSNDNAKIDLYFRYLDELFAFAESKKISFSTVDRGL